MPERAGEGEAEQRGQFRKISNDIRTNAKCDIYWQFFQSGWMWLNPQMQWSRYNALSRLSLVWVSLLEADTLAPWNLDWAGGFFLPCFLFGLSPQKSDQRSGKRPLGLWVRRIVEMCSALLRGSSRTECKLVGAMFKHIQIESNIFCVLFELWSNIRCFPSRSNW